MGLLDGKSILVTGVLTDASLAFGVAELALAEGAEIVLTGAGRGFSLTERVARKLSSGVEVLELDVTVPRAGRGGDPSRSRRVGGASTAHCTRSGSRPRRASATGSWTRHGTTSSTAVHISTYSLKTIAEVCRPLMTDGGSIVGLDFDATVAWPAYNWMGVAKAGLESLSRYLARELGPDRHQGEPRRGGAGPHDGRQVDPGVRRVRGRVGGRGRRSGGTCTTPPAWPRPAWPCCRTGSPRRPAR